MPFHFTAKLALGLENTVTVPLGWHNRTGQLKAGSEEEITNEMSGEYKVNSLSLRKEDHWESNCAPAHH